VSTSSAIASIPDCELTEPSPVSEGEIRIARVWRSSADADITDDFRGHLTVSHWLAHRRVDLLIVEQSSLRTLATPWLTVPITPPPSQTGRASLVGLRLTRRGDSGLHRHAAGLVHIRKDWRNGQNLCASKVRGQD